MNLIVRFRDSTAGDLDETSRLSWRIAKPSMSPTAMAVHETILAMKIRDDDIMTKRELRLACSFPTPPTMGLILATW